MSRSVVAAILLIFVALPAVAGEPDSLEKLLGTDVAVVSRHLERSSDAPATVTVITAAEIKKQGFRTIADVLRTVPGVFVHYDRSYELVGIRGIGALGDYSTRILILLDGHAINSEMAITNSFLGGDELVDLAAVERIEVVKGPASATYGSAAILGVINIVTRSGSDVDGLELSGRGASVGFRRELAAVAGRRWANGIDAMASLRGLDAVGEDLTYADRGGVASGRDYERALQAFGRVRGGDVSASFDFVRRLKGLPDAPYGATFDSSSNYYVNRYGFGALEWSHRFGPKIETHANLSADFYEFDGNYLYTPDPTFRDHETETWYTAGADAAFSPAPATRLAAGVTATFHEARLYSRSIGVAPVLDENHRFGTQLVWVQAEQTFLSGAVRLIAGATLYRNELFDARVTPKFGGVFRLGAHDTAKVLYGEGFRTPTLFERYYHDGIAFVENPAVKPEHGRTLETSWEHLFGDRVRASVAAHLDRYDGLISEEESMGFNQYQNVSYLEAAGIETAIQADLGRSWILRAGHGWSTAREVDRDPDEQPHLANFASQVLNGSVWGDVIPSKLSLGFDGFLLAPRRRLATPSELAVDPGARHAVPAAGVANASLRYNAGDGLSFRLSVRNLFDSRYLDPVASDHQPVAAMSQDGRSFNVTIDLRH